MKISATPRTINNQSESLTRYFKEINSYPVLTPKEEVELFKQYKLGDKRAFNTLLKCNLRFVISVAKRNKSKFLSVDDLINEGNLGLMHAITRFDHTKGFKFISFAVWWIRQSITDAIVSYDRMVRIPLNRERELSRINKASRYLEMHLQYKPSAEEIADFTGLRSDVVRDVLLSSQEPVSLDEPAGTGKDGEEWTRLDLLSDNDEAAQYSESDKAKVAGLLSHLEAREADVLSLYFGLSGFPAPVGDIAELFDRSDVWVRQVISKSIHKLKEAN